MKYNSIGEQLIAKAQELDPHYKPDKFNDMSEAINIILNNSGSGGSSGGGKLEGFSIDVSNTYNSETKEFSGILTDEQWTKVQNEQIYWINVVYINNQETGEEASATLLYNGPFFGEGRTFADGNGSAMFVYDKSVEGVIIKAALTVDTQGTPTSQLIPSITTSNEQQNLTIGNGLEIKNGALQTTGGGGGGSGSNVKIFQPTITNVNVSTLDDNKQISIMFSANNEVETYIHSLVDRGKNFSANLFLKTVVYNDYQIRLISPLSLINILGGNAVFIMCGRLIQGLTSKIDFQIEFSSTDAILIFYFDNNDVYTQFKQLASLLFTTDTILKLTIKTDE